MSWYSPHLVPQILIIQTCSDPCMLAGILWLKMWRSNSRWWSTIVVIVLIYMFIKHFLSHFLRFIAFFPPWAGRITLSTHCPRRWMNIYKLEYIQNHSCIYRLLHCVATVYRRQYWTNWQSSELQHLMWMHNYYFSFTLFISETQGGRILCIKGTETSIWMLPACVYEIFGK